MLLLIPFQCLFGKGQIGDALAVTGLLAGVLDPACLGGYTLRIYSVRPGGGS